MLTSEALKPDFKLFLTVTWALLGLPKPTSTQYEIADYLQHGPKRAVVQAFRGVGKSWVTSAYVCWLLLNNPQLNILVVSASKQRADDFSTFTLRLINELFYLQHLRPDERRGQRHSKVAFDVGPAGASHAPSVKSVGITGQLTGSRADVIIADDIEVSNNSATQAMRDNLAHLTKEFSAILKPDNDDARIVYLGTPQTEQSIYNRLPERGYEIRIWPAKYPGPELRAKYGERLSPRLAALLDKDPTLAMRPTDERFPEDVLIESLVEYGLAGFSLQFMLDTSLADADRYPLRLRDLIVMDCDPLMGPVELAWGNDSRTQVPDVPNVGLDGDRIYGPMMVSKDKWEPYQGVIMAIDPSGRGTDETGYAVVAHLYGRLFLLKAGGFRNGYDEATLVGLANIAKRYRVNAVVVEPNFGDGMFNKLLQPVMNRIHPCPVEDSARAKGQKEARIIDSLEPVVQQHRLVVDTNCFREDYQSTENLPPEQQSKYRLWHQFTRITKQRGALAKDDRLDAVAIGVHYWTEVMEKDTHRAAEDRRAELLQAELTKFMQSAGSTWGSPQDPGPLARRPLH